MKKPLYLKKRKYKWMKVVIKQYLKILNIQKKHHLGEKTK